MMHVDVHAIRVTKKCSSQERSCLSTGRVCAALSTVWFLSVDQASHFLYLFCFLEYFLVVKTSQWNRSRSVLLLLEGPRYVILIWLQMRWFQFPCESHRPLRLERNQGETSPVLQSVDCSLFLRAAFGRQWRHADSQMCDLAPKEPPKS